MGILLWPIDYSHKVPVTQKVSKFIDVDMYCHSTVKECYETTRKTQQYVYGKGFGIVLSK